MKSMKKKRRKGKKYPGLEPDWQKRKSRADPVSGEREASLLLIFFLLFFSLHPVRDQGSHNLFPTSSSSSSSSSSSQEVTYTYLLLPSPDLLVLQEGLLTSPSLLTSLAVRVKDALHYTFLHHHRFLSFILANQSQNQSWKEFKSLKETDRQIPRKR